jgi:outer membrane protein assembly factor BamB
VGTALLPLRDLSFADLTRQTLRNAALEIWSNIVLPPRTAGQVIFALDLHTGAVTWKSRVFGQAYPADGHTSGTPVFDGETGIVILPVPDSIVAFNRASGTVRWTASAHRARGPSLIVDGHVIVAGRDGVTEVRTVATGAVTCTMKRKVGYDRAGPALAAGTLVFADLNGLIEAIPLQALLACDAAQLVDRTPAQSTSGAAHSRH